MKKLLSVLVLLVASMSLVASPIAEAKRFGGGKSFGKSFKTAPAPKQQQNTNSINRNTTTQGNKSGLMGGLMGGLLAGGLLAAFFGGAFEGVNFMDILILGAIAFFGFKFLRGMLGAKAGSMNQQRTAYSGAQTGSQGYQRDAKGDHDFNTNFTPNNGGGFGTQAQSDVPHNFYPGFDQSAFVDGSREHYRILQGAWNHNQLETIKEYVSDDLYQELVADRNELGGEQHTDIIFIDAEIVRADYNAERAQLSLQFKGRYRDAVEGIEEDITDVWHLERDMTQDNAPWLIVGIQGS
jgi:predicted lipid-binding transport protein (Tim44 family)